VIKRVKSPGSVKHKTAIQGNIGKVLINLGQVVFGTLFLGSVLRGEIPQYMMMVAGIIGAVMLLTIGIVLVSKEPKGMEE
jgi:putative Mn2+ efflux pump MntP